MLCIDVRCHQHLAAGEEPLRQLQRDLVGLGRGDVLLGREGLNILVEKCPVCFAVQAFGGHECLLRQVCRTVDASEIAPTVRAQRFLVLGHIADDARHSPGRLLGLLNEAARRHEISPRFV